MEISRLHYISQETKDKSHVENVKEACAAGARWVQLRLKNKSIEEIRLLAKQAKEICDQHDAILIINDHVDLAGEVGAHGVHLGKSDMSPTEARKILGSSAIVGCTANTLEDVLFLHERNVDYIGLGPFRFTTTKENLSPILGVEGYEKIISQSLLAKVTTPVIAIGGIQLDDLESLLKTGIHGVAISSAINNAQDKTGQIRLLYTKIETFSNSVSL